MTLGEDRLPCLYCSITQSEWNRWGRTRLTSQASFFPQTVSEQCSMFRHIILLVDSTAIEFEPSEVGQFRHSLGCIPSLFLSSSSSNCRQSVHSYSIDVLPWCHKSSLSFFLQKERGVKVRITGNHCFMMIKLKRSS